jgi:hypothetical protein
LLTFSLPGILRSFEAQLFLAIWMVYALHVVPGGGVNPNRYFDLTHSLVNQHSITIDAYHENTIDKAFKDGHYYSVGLPGPSVAGIPAYLTFKVIYDLLPAGLLRSLAHVQSLKQGQGGFYQQDNTEFFLSTIWITWFTLSLLSAFAAVVLFKLFLCIGVTRGNALLATVAYAFGTPVFFYSTTFFGHGFSASIAILTLYLLVRFSHEDRPSALILLGFTAGLAVLMEYQSVIMAAGVGIYLLVRSRYKPFSYYCLGGTIPLVLLLFYNTLAFGGPFHATYEFMVGPNQPKFAVGFHGFTLPKLDQAFGLTFSVERGLFIYSPILLLAFAGWAYGLRKKRSVFGFTLLSILIFLGLLLWMASFVDWYGGSSFGARYLVCALPFLAVGVALSLSFVPKLISLPLVALSVATNWLGAQYGFVESVWEPWSRFWSSGFVLPAVDAIVSHSRGENAITAFVTHHSWLIAALYILLVAGCVFIVVTSFSRSKREALSRA